MFVCQCQSNNNTSEAIDSGFRLEYGNIFFSKLNNLCLRRTFFDVLLFFGIGLPFFLVRCTIFWCRSANIRSNLPYFGEFFHILDKLFSNLGWLCHILGSVYQKLIFPGCLRTIIQHWSVLKPMLNPFVFSIYHIILVLIIIIVIAIITVHLRLLRAFGHITNISSQMLLVITGNLLLSYYYYYFYCTYVSWRRLEYTNNEQQQQKIRKSELILAREQSVLLTLRSRRFRDFFSFSFELILTMELIHCFMYISTFLMLTCWMFHGFVLLSLYMFLFCIT